jgi:predicted dehydrogenase
LRRRAGLELREAASSAEPVRFAGCEYEFDLRPCLAPSIAPRQRSVIVSRVLNVVCTGAGWAARERHLPSLTHDPRVRVVGVVDPKPERAAELASRYSIPNASNSLDEPWTSEVDCLVVGAPPFRHGEIAEIAIERGWHCLCEKPFVIPSRHGAQLVERARAAGLVLAVVHNFQFSRAGSRLFELIESGRLGTLEAVHGFQLSNPSRHIPPWADSLPGGLFLDEGPHLLYLTRRILGRLEIRSADARLDGNRVRDVAVTFAHESLWATMTMSFNASIFEWHLVVVGSKGVGAFDIIRDLLIVVPNDGLHKARDVLRSSRAMIVGHAAGFASSGYQFARKQLFYGNDEVAKRFVDAVEGRPDRIRWMTGEEGVAVVACLEEILTRVGVELSPRP